MIRVIRRHASTGVLPLLISEIVIYFACFYAAAEILYPPSGWFYLFYDGGITLAAIAILTIIIAMYFFDLYAEVQVYSRVLLIQQLCQSLGVAIIAQTVAMYALRDWTVPHLMMLIACAFALVAIVLWRLLYSALLTRIVGKDRLLFLGRSSTAEAVAEAVESDPRMGFHVIGFLDDHADGPPVLGPASSLRAMVAEHKPRLLVVGMPERRASMPVADLVALRFGGLRIEEACQTFESVCQRVSLPDLSAQQLLFSRALAPRPNSVRLSRITGTALAILLLIVLSPVMLAIAVLLRGSPGKPALIRLPRVGKDGRLFTMLRFRREAGLPPFFQRFHLDALPELINVIRGEMAMVGPQPEDPEREQELARDLPFYGYRQSIPPGITGWAQINVNRKNIDDKRLALEYDLYYIKHLSQALNLYIVIHSLKNRILWP